MQSCGEACFGLFRQAPDDSDDPPPRAFYAVSVAEWRMAVVSTSDTDQVGDPTGRTASTRPTKGTSPPPLRQGPLAPERLPWLACAARVCRVRRADVI